MSFSEQLLELMCFVYSINDNLLPDLLLFESLHMDDDYYNKLSNHLINKGYSITKSGWNTICKK